MPENECPTSTVGPCWRRSTWMAAAVESSRVVNGFWTEVTFRLRACNSPITSAQQDPSANRPCSKTTFWAVAIVPARPDEGLAAVARLAAASEEKVLRFICVVPDVDSLFGMGRAGGLTPGIRPVHRPATGTPSIRWLTRANVVA